MERVRIVRVHVEVRLVPGAPRLPRVVAARAVEVVALHVGEVEVAEDLAQVPALVDLHLVGGRVKAVSRYRLPVVADSASSWRRNSAISAVLFALSCGPKWLPGCPSSPGHSQSRSMPSNTPAAEPGPPWPLYAGRLSLMYMSMQELTSFWREAVVAAASEKNLEYVQPPIDISTLRLGWRALSFLSWLKLPCSGWNPLSPTPSTDSPALNARP